MYNCDFCGRTAQKGNACIRIITGTRTHRHPYRKGVQKKWVIDKTGKRKIDFVDDPGGIGPQIVSEKKACISCSRKWEDA